MRLIGDIDDGSHQMLVAFAEVIDMVNQRDIADGKLGFVTLTGEGGEIDQSYIRLRPHLAFTVKQFAFKSGAEQVDGLRHFIRPLAAGFRQAVVAGKGEQCIADILR